MNEILMTTPCIKKYYSNPIEWGYLPNGTRSFIQEGNTSHLKITDSTDSSHYWEAWNIRDRCVNYTANYRFITSSQFGINKDPFEIMSTSTMYLDIYGISGILTGMKSYTYGDYSGNVNTIIPLEVKLIADDNNFITGVRGNKPNYTYTLSGTLKIYNKLKILATKVGKKVTSVCDFTSIELTMEPFYE